MFPRVLRAVAPRVFQLGVPGGGGVFLLLDRRVTLIDAGARGSAPHVLRALHLLGREPAELDQILITHYHPDHAGGVAGLLRSTPARVGVHAVEAPVVRGDALPPVPFRHVLLDRPLRPAVRLLRPPPAPVHTMLGDGDELPLLGGLRVVHTPGHTPGHIALQLRDLGLVIAGDALQVRRGDRIVPPHPLFTEDRAEALCSIRRLAAIDFDVLALSHFPPQRGDVRAQLAQLVGRLDDEGNASSGDTAQPGRAGTRIGCSR